jgi:hypothetical protein
MSLLAGEESFSQTQLVVCVRTIQVDDDDAPLRPNGLLMC